MISWLGIRALICSSCSLYCFRKPGEHSAASMHACIGARYFSCTSCASGESAVSGTHVNMPDLMSKSDFFPAWLRTLIKQRNQGGDWVIHTRVLFVFGVRPDRSGNRMSNNAIGALLSLLLHVLSIMATTASKTNGRTICYSRMKVFLNIIPNTL